MKKDWTYKKLGEVCKGEASNIALNKISDNIGEYPLYGASGLAKHIDFYKQDVEYIGIVKDGAGVGRVGLYPAKSSLVGTMQYIIPSSEVKLRYLFYVLKGLNLANLVSGATIPHIYFKDYSKITIPIPPISIQESIVAELDAIHGILEKKQAQLRELDNLAQAIFYDMFGDPITNPKQWEVKKWEDVLTIINGKNQRAVENPDGEYVICGSGGIMGRATQYLCPENSVIIGRKGNINKPILMREKYWNVDTAFGIVPMEDKLEANYLYHFCDCFDFENLNVAVTIPSLRKTDLLQISLPLPPLSLQQSFAAKIEAIEAQKQAVQQSIREVEALLAERMDCYFS